MANPRTADSGLFYFFGPNNWEILVKVLDACGPNGNSHFWVFAASATTLEFTLRVTDTQTGNVRTYFNPLGNPAAAITDTLAFPTCDGNPVEPPLVSYVNDLVCVGLGFTSQLSANGFSWTSFSGVPSPYQTVNRTSLGPTFTEVNNSICPNATYNGTLQLTAGRSYTLIQTLQNGNRIIGLVDEGPTAAVASDEPLEYEPNRILRGEEVPK